MNKQALIKLAQVRLAINYVLRNRMLKEGAFPWFNLPKLKDIEDKIGDVFPDDVNDPNYNEATAISRGMWGNEYGALMTPTVSKFYGTGVDSNRTNIKQLLGMTMLMNNNPVLQTQFMNHYNTLDTRGRYNHPVARALKYMKSVASNDEARQKIDRALVDFGSNKEGYDPLQIFRSGELDKALNSYAGKWYTGGYQKEINSALKGFTPPPLPTTKPAPVSQIKPQQGSNNTVTSMPTTYHK